jgi:hypothetical protein
VIRIVLGLKLTLYQWNDGGEFRVVAQIIPQVRDRNSIVRCRMEVREVHAI